MEELHIESKGLEKLLPMLIVALIIGGSVGYFIAPTKTVEVDVPGETVYVDVPGETVYVDVPVPTLSGTIPIGIIFNKDESFVHRGIVADIAMEDINEYVKKLGYDIEFELLKENADNQATVALEKLQSLVARGVQVVEGTGSSSQVKAMMEYATTQEVILFSCGSTSPELAVPDDYVFRLQTTLEVQTPALASIIWQTGVRHIVVINRADSSGDGGARAFMEHWPTIGGSIGSQIRYAAGTVEFSAEAAALNDEVTSLINTYGADKVGIVGYISDEIAALYPACKDYPALVETPWFGSGGFVLCTYLVEDVPDSYKTTFIVTNPSVQKSTKYDAFLPRVLERSGGRVPTSSDTNVYDCLWILVKSILEAGVYDGAVIKDVLPTVAEQYFGPSGWCELNEAGDRANAYNEIWTVRLVDGETKWVSAGMFDSATGKISWTLPILEELR